MKTAIETFPEIAKSLEDNPAVLSYNLKKFDHSVLLAPYKTKLVFSKGGYATAGRDSFISLTKVFGYGNLKQPESICDVGSFTQVAEGVRIVTGGEHHNDNVFNHTMSHWVDIKQILESNGVNLDADYTKGKVEIGSNVTISTGAIILSGVKIGNGAVIGAGSVVTKDVPPFARVAGNPAKVIRYRFDENVIDDLEKIKWWDLSVPFFLNNLQHIRNLQDESIRRQFLALDKNAYDNNNNYLVFSTLDDLDNKRFIFMGAEVNGQFISNNDLPDIFQFFMLQMYNQADQDCFLIKDIFKLSGLV